MTWLYIYGSIGIALQEKGNFIEVSIVKAKRKTVFLSILAILDCLLGSAIIYDVVDSVQHKKDAPIRTSSNYVVVEDFFEPIIAAYKEASIEELCEVHGINESLAKKILLELE